MPIKEQVKEEKFEKYREMYEKLESIIMKIRTTLKKGCPEESE